MNPQFVPTNKDNYLCNWWWFGFARFWGKVRFYCDVWLFLIQIYRMETSSWSPVWFAGWVLSLYRYTYSSQRCGYSTQALMVRHWSPLLSGWRHGSSLLSGWRHGSSLLLGWRHGSPLLSGWVLRHIWHFTIMVVVFFFIIFLYCWLKEYDWNCVLFI